MARTKLFVSELMFEEARKAIAMEMLENVDVIPYAAGVVSANVAIGSLSKLLNETPDSDAICILGSECVQTEAMLPPHAMSAHFVEVLSDQELIAGRSFVKQLFDQGSLLITPGLLRRWKEDHISVTSRCSGDIERSGMTARKIVLLDTGIDDDITNALEELSAELKLPSERIIIGLDHFRLKVSNGILYARLEKGVGSEGLAKRSEARVRADFNLVLNLLQEISRESDEKKIVFSILHIMDVLFAPEREEFYSIGDDRSVLHFVDGVVESAKDVTFEDMQSMGDGYDSKILGFSMKVENEGQLIGVVILKDIAFPELWKQYAELGMKMAPIFGLAIANARHIHSLTESEKEVKRALSLERTALEISQLFIGQVDVDKAIARSLELIGNASDSDRASYFEISSDLANLEKTHGWYNERAYLSHNITKPVPITEMTWLITRLNEMGELLIEDIDKIPQDAKGQLTPFIDAGVRSMVLVPVIVDGHTYGCISLQDVKGPRTWIESDLAVLKFLGRTMSMSFQDLKNREDVLGLNQALMVTNKVLRHDIKNEMLIVNGSLELFSIKNDKRNMDRAFASLVKIQNIIEQFKQLDSFLLSGKGLFPCKIADTIESVMTAYPMKYRIDGNATIMADFALTSVIDNLVRNSKTHGEAENMEFDVRTNGPFVELVVADDGHGIPIEIRDKIFQEGFSSGIGKSTGLGLFLIKKTMDRYGGHIIVEENKPKGAKFVLSFPRGRE